MNRSALFVAVAACFSVAAAPWARAQALAPASEAGKAERMESIVVQGTFIDISSASGMKSNVPVRDTPFTVGNYTDAFMKAIETTTVADLYSYMTGIQRGGTTGYDINIRGFSTNQADKNAILVNGLPGLAQRFGSPPVSGTDHVEVIKGASGVLYGQAQPGGFVNIVTKKPEEIFGATVDLRASTYASRPKFGDENGFNGVVDLTGPIDAAAAWRYRLIGEMTRKDTFRHAGFEDSEYAAPSVLWKIAPKTSLLIQGEYRHSTTSYDQNMVIPNRNIDLVPEDIRIRYQEPGDEQREEGKAVSVSLAHEFGPGLTLNAATRIVRTEDEARGYDNVAVRSNLRSLQRRARQQHNDRTYDFFDVNLGGAFALGPVKNQALVGVNGGKDTTDFDRLQFFNGGACPGPQCIDIDIYNPVYGAVPSLDSLPRVNPATPANLNRRLTTSRSTGVYATDQLTFTEQWKASVGVRYFRDKQTQEELKLPNVPTTSKSVSDTIPMGGIIFQPDKVWSFYASASTSFVPPPSTAQDVNGQNTFEPEKAKQYEVGVKSDHMGGRLLTTFAIYQITKENALSTFACPIGTCTQQVGEQESKGAEFEMDIRITDRWQTALGYAYTNAKVTQSADGSQVGARLPNVAKNVAHIWTRFHLKEVKGLSLGLGAFYNGERAGNLPTSANRAVIRLPSYAVVDVAAYYIWDRYSMALKVGNVSDRRYFESTGATADVQLLPGAPRNISLSLRTQF
jgi:iron complex outermembrane receptor protein